MAVPLLVWGAVALGTGVVSLATALAVSKWRQEKKTVAFIGRSGSGKTSLAHFLEHERLPERDCPPTIGQTKHEGSADGLSIIVVDSAGDRLAQWMRGVGSASGVVYFFDASLVAKGDPEALSALAADAEHLKDLFSGESWTGERRFTLLGTHADLFESKGDEQLVRKAWQVQALRNACDLGDNGVVIGSLVQERSAARLASKVARRQMRAKE